MTVPGGPAFLRTMPPEAPDIFSHPDQAVPQLNTTREAPPMPQDKRVSQRAALEC